MGWQTDGKIKWDYDIQTVKVDVYPELARLAIEILCVVLLVLNCLPELCGAAWNGRGFGGRRVRARFEGGG